MENRSYALFTGLFVLGLIAAIVVTAIWLTDRLAEDHERYVVVSEHSVTDLNRQASVEYRGVRVGRVEEIKLDPEQPGQVLVVIAVEPHTPITEATYGRLRMRGVTGRAALELDTKRDEARPLATSPEEPGRIPMQPSLMGELADSGQQIMEQTELLARNLNAWLTDENRRRVERILENTEAATAELAQLQEHVGPAMEGVPELTEELRETLTTINRLSRNLDGLTDDLRARTPHLDELQTTLERLGDSGERAGEEFVDRTLPEVHQTLEEIRRAARSLDALGQSLREDPSRLWRGSPLVEPGPGEEGYRRTQ